MTWHSQAGQDEWVHSLIGDSGYFVDVGAHDGVVHSNTYALEQLGWIGICVEASLDGYVALVNNRPSTTCFYKAASDHSGICLMMGHQVVSGPGGIVTDCDPLAVLLERSFAPPVIDYLSIDVEGHELEVLAGMDFDRWHVRCITIEHNLYCDGPARKVAIFEHLTANGFERVREDVVAEGYGPYEDWYVLLSAFASVEANSQDGSHPAVVTPISTKDPARARTQTGTAAVTRGSH